MPAIELSIAWVQCELDHGKTKETKECYARNCGAGDVKIESN